MLDRLWKPGQVAREISVEKPVLASWDHKDHPSQLRLSDYLASIVPALLPLPPEPHLFLHYDIGVNHERQLLSGCDLENYVFPLFGAKWLPAERFALVTANKRVHQSSTIRIGIAVDDDPPCNEWFHSFVNAGRGSSTSAWKERVRDVLAIDTMPLGPGPACVHIAYRCAPHRNWTLLWKPSGDAMGPILGTTRDMGFHPCDDRIVELSLHRLVDESLGHNVELGYWWKLR